MVHSKSFIDYANSILYEMPKSRSIDIDIIDYGGLVYSSDKLTLPHPRARYRQFVLRPLIEIKPDFCFPDSSDSLSQLVVNAEPNKMESISQLIPLD